MQTAVNHKFALAMEFSNVEKRDMVECYIQCQKNSTRAAEVYFENYFDRRQPSLPTFKRLWDNLADYGSFVKPKSKKGMDEDREINILASVAQNPSTSTRQISTEMGSSQRTIVRVLKKHKFRPYKLSVSQTLHEGDNIRRIAFCRWFKDQCQNDPHFSMKILWTDESRFTNCGMFNRHNEHIWSQTNPLHVEHRRPQIKFGFNVWCGVIGSTVLPPFIFDGSLTGNRYLNFLQQDFAEMLDNLNLRTRAMLQWFQHDGAPPHNQLNVRNYLNLNFPNQWIGRNAPIEWPARSPDLSVLDFFLWGVLKDTVYKRTYETIDDLREAVLVAFNNIDRRKVRNATNSVVKRCNLCINNNGGIFEH